ncbi:hypothetical protein KDA_59080 [Dictyobacter alpinus]|uniref:Ricin B lectin domain-containing protein n=1 Tax=Dictyobacter alpinus TaxID=2014873 RepID=A0A402BGA1_9CHLR|nr:hypothetical protein [Dictyobacter alpinus]GCE30424.1 hypothetical protein KDA_59080 [Dictyobacter alpinus]
MSIKNLLVRLAGITTAVMICLLSLTNMASASAAQPSFISPTGTTTGCAFLTNNGHFLTAMNGGGGTTDSIRTNETSIRSWEKFSIVGLGTTGYAIQTSNHNWLTAVNGGGVGLGSTDAIHTNATVTRSWEIFQLVTLFSANQYAIQTSNGNYVTAVDGGGRKSETIHTDATRLGSWEIFTITCGH